MSSCRQETTGDSDPKTTRKFIKSVYARNIFDSRGNPTIEVDLITDLGLFRASVPSGVSTGAYEALELRDNVPGEYLGRGVSKAINNINTIISPELVKKNFDVTEQEKIDELLIALDGTENKTFLGANAIFAVSLVVCKAGAAKRGVPLYRHIANLSGNKQFILPVPAFNLINGGINATNKLPFQEYMILPIGATSFKEALRMGVEVYQNLKNAIKTKYGADATNVGEEGAFSPKCPNNKEALKFIKDAIKKAGYTGRIEVAIDAAATEFYKKGLYDMDFKNKKSDKKKWLKKDKLNAMYVDLIKNYQVISIEDPFDQDDWDPWTNITAKTDVQIVGDNLTATNPKRMQMAIDKNACNSFLLKPNQIGTITEAIRAHLLAKQNNWGTMVSHRLGETDETFIADFVVGLGTGQIKAGAPCRSDRLGKYNQMLRIEEELGVNAVYAGRAFRKPQ